MWLGNQLFMTDSTGNQSETPDCKQQVRYRFEICQILTDS